MARTSLPIRLNWLIIGLLGVIIAISSLVMYGKTLFTLVVFVYIILVPILTMALRQVGKAVA